MYFSQIGQDHEKVEKKPGRGRPKKLHQTAENCPLQKGLWRKDGKVGCADHPGEKITAHRNGKYADGRQRWRIRCAGCVRVEALTKWRKRNPLTRGPYKSRCETSSA